MNKNIKIVIGVLVAAIIIIGSIFGIKAFAEKIGKDKEKSKVIATVSGESIIKRDFDVAKENIILGGMKMGDQEILSRMTVQKALYLDAAKNKTVLADNELKKLVEEQKGKVEKNSKYQTLKSDLKKLGISEKEYWESETQRIKENTIRGLYKSILRKQFVQVNKDQYKNNMESKFNEYYNNVTSDAIYAADIKILVEYK